MEINFIVYVLKSKIDGNFYVGYTTNLKRRLFEHNSGIVDSTKNRKPLEVMYYEVCYNKDDALHREKYLKTSYGKKYLKSRLKNYLTGREVQSVSSRADFINKINISLKEMRESNYWLRIFTAVSNKDKDLDYLKNESEELKKILGAIYSKSSRNK